ncbi:MAG: hypothetical protein E6F96_07845 [Actinobacteria bacterium]|nr:MAG: hypothetical protein E6F96_07845 [Actinomycetota bacterium]
MNPTRHRRSTPFGSAAHTARVALLVAAIAIGCLLQAQGAASASSSEATLSVSDSGGKAAELLHRLTIPQAAAALNTTPAKLMLATEVTNATASAEVGELFASPTATLGEVLNLLAAHGISAEPLEHAINGLLAGAGESAEQLPGTISAALADLAKDGQIGAVASELGLPPAAVEAAHLLPSSVERVASMLDTTSEHVGSTLARAGAATRPLTASSPLAAASVERVVQGGETVLVGTPTGTGGVSLTTINSTSASGNAPAGAGVSNAFSIVSIKVTKAGAIQETVRLPGPGRLTINASMLKRVAVKSRSSRKRSLTRRTTLASAATTVSGGTRTLTLRLRGASHLPKRVLVRLATTYTPTGGSANTIQRSVTVRRAAGRKRR